MLEVFAVGAVWFYFIMRRRRAARRLNNHTSEQEQLSESKRNGKHFQNQVFYDAKQTTKYVPMQTEPVVYRQIFEKVRSIPDMPKSVEKPKPIQYNMPQFHKKFNFKTNYNGFSSAFGVEPYYMEFQEHSENSEIVGDVGEEMVKIGAMNSNQIDSNTNQRNNPGQKINPTQQVYKINMPIPLDNSAVQSQKPKTSSVELLSGQSLKIATQEIKQRQDIEEIEKKLVTNTNKTTRQKQKTEQKAKIANRQQNKKKQKNLQQQRVYQYSQDSLQQIYKLDSSKSLKIQRQGKKIKKSKPSNNPLSNLEIKSIGKIHPSEYRQFYDTHSKALINHLPPAIIQKRHLKSSNLTSRILQSQTSSIKQPNPLKHNYILNGENYDPFNEAQKIQCLTLW